VAGAVFLPPARFRRRRAPAYGGDPRAAAGAVFLSPARFPAVTCPLTVAIRARRPVRGRATVLGAPVGHCLAVVRGRA